MADKYRIPNEIWALIIGGFCIALGIGIVGPIIPQLATSFGVSVAAAAAIVSAFALMRILAAPFASWFVNRTNERLGYISGLFFVAATTFACGFANSYGMLLTFRTLSGIGSVVFTVAASTLMIRLAPATMRGRILSYNAASFLLGALIGPIIGAMLAGFSMQTPFFVYTGLLLLAGAYVAVSLRRSSLKAYKPEGAPRTEVLHLKTALNQRAFKAAMYSGFATGWAVWGVRISIIPLFVAAIADQNIAAPGWALAAYAAGNAALVIPSGRMNDRFGRKPLVLIGFTISALAYAALPFVQDLTQVLVIMTVAGVGSALLNPAQNAAVADVIGNRNGSSAISAHSMVLDLGSVIGPLLIGYVIDIAGYSTGFFITAAILASTVLVWALAPETNVYSSKNKLPQTAELPQPQILEVGPETGAIPIINPEQKAPESK